MPALCLGAASGAREFWNLLGDYFWTCFAWFVNGYGYLRQFFWVMSLRKSLRFQCCWLDSGYTTTTTTTAISTKKSPFLWILHVKMGRQAAVGCTRQHRASAAGATAPVMAGAWRLTVALAGVLKDPVPQGRLGQHCGVGYELVQALAVPVPQMVEQHVDVLSFLGSSLPAVAEQVIEVPALSLPVCAVQVRFPTNRRWRNSWWKCRPSYLLPWSLSSSIFSPRTECNGVRCQQIADIPVRGGLHRSPQDRIKQRPVSSRSLTFLLETNKIFTSVRAQQIHPLALRTMLLHGFFTTFHRDKKSARVAASPSARVPRHVSSWTPAAYGQTIGSVEWAQVFQGGKTHSASARSQLTVGSGTYTGILVPVLGSSHLFLLADGSRGEGLGIPSPFLGATRVVDKGGKYKAGVAGFFHFALCSFRLVTGPDAWRSEWTRRIVLCSFGFVRSVTMASRPVWIRRTVMC